SRSKKRFWIGVFARISRYIGNRYAVYVARMKGATIGEHVSISLSLARRANSNLIIGSHTSIQTDKLGLRAKIIIGSHVIIGKDVEIITGSHQLDSPDWESKRSDLQIEDYVWISTKAIILPACNHIGKGAVIGAGSVVTKNVESMHVVGGNPSTFLRLRKEVHYNLCVEGLLGNDLITYFQVRKKLKDVN